MNKPETIDQFLKAWAEYGKQNPEFSFRKKEANDLIYHNLILLGVSPKDRKLDISPLFSKWQDFFHNYNNLDVISDPSKNYFCQFVSKDQTAKNSKEKIKVFVPLDGEHIERGTKELFAFLANRNIPHQSKVSRKIRFDDIVVGLSSEKDAKALLEFIKKNPYLQEGLIAPNPFAFQQNGVALACDGDYSYNGTLTALLQMYLNNKKSHNELDKVNYENFFDFLADCYTDEFIIGDDKPFERALGYGKDDKAKRNFQFVFSLIAKTQNPSYDLDDFMAHFRRSLADKQEGKGSEELLIECVDAMSKYYQNSRKGIVNVESYVVDNVPRRLTNKNNLRERVVRSNMREDVLSAMRRDNTTFKDYLKKVMDKYGYDPTQYDNGTHK